MRRAYYKVGAQNRNKSRAQKPNMGREHGLTLLEVIVTTAILAVMMAMVWQVMSGTAEAKREFGKIQERNHEIRLALAYMARDLSMAYISGNEDTQAPVESRRTLFMGTPESPVGSLRFSSFAHNAHWSQANESEQTMITYLAESDPEMRRKTNLIRKELRRPSSDRWESQPAQVDLLLRDIESVEFQFFDPVTTEWKERWNSTGADGELNRVPTRVKVTIVVNSEGNKKRTYTTQAKIALQERVSFF